MLAATEMGWSRVYTIGHWAIFQEAHGNWCAYVPHGHLIGGLALMAPTFHHALCAAARRDERRIA